MQYEFAQLNPVQRQVLDVLGLPGPAEIFGPFSAD